MNNFIETLDLNSLIESIPFRFPSSNFEDIYSVIHSDTQLDSLREALEKTVYNYFASMQLPDYPTIYDHLVLSLRNKDFIATFNWDPLTNRLIGNLKNVMVLISGDRSSGAMPDKVISLRSRMPMSRALEESQLIIIWTPGLIPYYL